MAAKITPIRVSRRSADAEVVKLICNCDAQAFTFRVTAIGEQVFAECAICLQDYGPFYLRQVAPPPPDEKEPGSD